MAYRTLGALRSELLSRLGMGAMGASGGANQTLIDSFLRNGQHQLYWMQDWRRLTDYKDYSTGVGQNLYDYPDAGVMVGSHTASRDQRILRVEVLHAGQFIELREGITTDNFSTMDTQGPPSRYERFAQLLVYPKSDQVYTMRVWFVADLGRFTEANDAATLDDEMILLHATAHAKAHYRQPDAKLYADDLEVMLSRIRGQSLGSDGVYRRGSAPAQERRPAVEGRDA
jgi:hypothetical protein